MTTVTLTYPSSGEIGFELGEATGENAFFVLGIRKSGSTLLNIIVSALARVNKVPFVNVAGTFFAKNVPVSEWIGDPQLRELLQPGHAYGGFRNYPESLADAPLFRQSPKVLLVRDPRDALVSEYFSNAYSHSIPEGDETTGAAAQLLAERDKALATSIDTYVLERAGMLRRTIAPVIGCLVMPNIRLFRYEDVILQKGAMIQAIARHFGWRCPEPFLQNLLARVDLRPQAETPQAFVRKVVPGDHIEKLAPETIRRLNNILAPVMGPLGYF